MAGWEWVGMKTPHYLIYLSQVADHQTLLMDPSFCIVICRRLQTAMLDFTLHVHETLLALTLQYMCRPIFKIYQLCALLSLVVICCLIEILIAVPEWERERMGITNGNGKEMAKFGIGNGNGN